MRYLSCSSAQTSVSFEEAVLTGWGEDNSMLLPADIPSIPLPTILRWKSLPYPSLARIILRYFVSPDEISDDDWTRIFDHCYDHFLNPVVDYAHLEGLTVADLSRGPSLAFKDLGMQCLCSVLDFFLQRRSTTMTVLVGTSGDTGPSAMVALKGRLSMNIIVLYPLGRVSEEQEAQMLSYDADSVNARCFGVEGTSDELDAPIEAVFRASEFRRKHVLGSVNSVNVLRLLAQVVHFFDMYLHEVRSTSESAEIDVAIPSGAAGHLTAAVIAKLMGLPIARMIVSTNANDILHRMLTQGRLVREDKVQRTLASAMDISVPYNIERLLFLASKGDVHTVRGIMDSLRQGQPTTIPTNVVQWFKDIGMESMRVSDDEILETIRWTHFAQNSVQDPHTAVGIAAARRLQSAAPSIRAMYCMGCANPAKFGGTLVQALGAEEAEKAKEVLGRRSIHAQALLTSVSQLPSLRLTARKSFCRGEDWETMLKEEIVNFEEERMS